MLKVSAQMVCVLSLVALAWWLSRLFAPLCGQ